LSSFFAERGSVWRAGGQARGNVQAFAIDPNIFEQHSSQGVWCRNAPLRNGRLYFLLAKDLREAGMTDRTLAVHPQGAGERI